MFSIEKCIIFPDIAPFLGDVELSKSYIYSIWQNRLLIKTKKVPCLTISLPSSLRWSISILLQLTSPDMGRCLPRRKRLVIFPEGTSLESLWPFTIEQTTGHATFWIQISIPLAFFFLTERKHILLVLRKCCQPEHWMDQLGCAFGKFGFYWQNIPQVMRQNVYVYFPEDLAQITFQNTFLMCQIFKDTTILFIHKKMHGLQRIQPHIPLVSPYLVLFCWLVTELYQ